MAPARQPSYFGSLCILVLSVEWIVFGSMHFSFHQQTMDQLPDYFGSAKGPIVTVTGMIEVVIGVLFLVPSARKWAALVSLVLLVLYIPAYYQILSNEAAISGPQAWRVVFRTVLIPNNVFLAICSVYLWRHPDTEAVGVGRIWNEALGRRQPMISQRATWLVAFLLLAANLAGFIAIWTSGIDDFATACLWAMMCLSTGAFLGFLFAVPKVNPDAKSTASLLPNTNIETISDWLTKIIVGVGLIQLTEIGTFVKGQSVTLAGALKVNEPFALALIVYFFVTGLIEGYLLTRMFLAWQFSLLTSGPEGEKGK